MIFRDDNRLVEELEPTMPLPELSSKSWTRFPPLKKSIPLQLIITYPDPLPPPLKARHMSAMREPVLPYLLSSTLPFSLPVIPIFNTSTKTWYQPDFFISI